MRADLVFTLARDKYVFPFKTFKDTLINSIGQELGYSAGPEGFKMGFHPHCLPCLLGWCFKATCRPAGRTDEAGIYNLGYNRILVGDTSGHALGKASAYSASMNLNYAQGFGGQLILPNVLQNCTGLGTKVVSTFNRQLFYFSYHILWEGMMSPAMSVSL